MTASRLDFDTNDELSSRQLLHLWRLTDTLYFLETSIGRSGCRTWTTSHPQRPRKLGSKYLLLNLFRRQGTHLMQNTVPPNHCMFLPRQLLCLLHHLLRARYHPLTSVALIRFGSSLAPPRLPNHLLQRIDIVRGWKAIRASGARGRLRLSYQICL